MHWETGEVENTANWRSTVVGLLYFETERRFVIFAQEDTEHSVLLGTGRREADLGWPPFTKPLQIAISKCMTVLRGMRL